MTTKTELKNYFENIPTKDQFWNWMDSYWHKEEELPVKHKLNLKTIPFNVKSNIENNDTIGVYTYLETPLTLPAGLNFITSTISSEYGVIMNNNYNLHVLDYLGVDPITQFNKYRLDVYLNSTNVKLLAKKDASKDLKIEIIGETNDFKILFNGEIIASQIAFMIQYHP
ncbi:hypothetical protein HZP39_09275 [Elizabethkingia anophelis]|uniref:hypothetical protein n=1 Tax=Elizabethkingia TaxID=308865 RepID=UPI001A21045F|nr:MULTISPECIES: hypothetical protein [Elizabethkingia]MCT3671119.1 hypothetical protein [Elizabethkingia anophelis]MCT3688792.1 hypothetical protein [Elizabethkingia anophelis]MCT3707255.1 hypothetical protein [Elizabethkingia anophelis]MCT3714739.1 hypothetical protein [Elizabethkingia anophelis]MCT3718158.1 hypothetical protein [Elizabethkingia anophelis]